MKQKENLLKKKGNRGITLVALVVTIVVLLILAGITITLIFSDSGIITKAREAAEATKNAQSDTEQGLNDLAEDLAVASGEYDWKLSDDGKRVINKNYPDGIEIGSYVKYDCTPVDGSKTTHESKQEQSGYDQTQTFTTEFYKDKDWRVLGVDNRGQLLLISDKSVYSDSNGYGNYYLEGKTGCENGIEELNKICDLYGHGKGATGGRMLTIEEVNKMTGYDPNNIDGKGTKYHEGQMDEYGNKVTYYWNGQEKPYYEYTNSEGLKSGNLTGNYPNGFTYYDESTKKFTTSTKPTTTPAEKTKITTIISTNYYYNVSESSIKESNKELYNTLFEGNCDYYWLESVAVDLGLNHNTAWGIGYVESCDVCAGYYGLAYSSGDDESEAKNVRPLVSLKSNIKLKVDENTPTKNGCTVYDIV